MTMTSHSDVKTSQFEAIKVAMKQDKDGYVLTLRIHPDEVPEEILRDFVGSRYQVVMVRLNGDEQPMDRQREFERDRALRLSHILTQDSEFWEFLNDDLQILNANQEEAEEWLKNYIGVKSRSELKTNPHACSMVDKIHREFMEWRNKR